jgi:hypothetical protein
MEPKTDRFIFSAPPSLIRRLDDWRRRQDDLPSRAEAVRRLIEEGLTKSESR